MSDLGFPGSSVAKNPLAKAGDMDSIPGSGRSPGEGNDNPIQYSCLENPLGQRSLAGYSPWGHKVLDTIEVTEQQQQLVGYNPWGHKESGTTE